MAAISAEKIIKHSVAYGFAFTQPLAMYIDAYPMLQDQLMFDVQGLQYGDNSDSVLHLQTKLNNLGYYDDKMDGKYGLLTEHAVKKFQSNNKITVNGKTDLETIETLVIVEQQEEAIELNKIIMQLNEGDRNEDVRFVQEKLFLLGYYKDKVDSIYGPLTKQAIIDYQQVHFPSEVPVDVPTNNVLEKEINKDTKQITPTQENKPEESKPEEIKQAEIKQVREQSAETNENHQTLIEHATALKGIPYVWGGTTTNGFDCSGFIQYIYGQDGTTIPRTVTDIWNFSSPVTSASIGDLVFFETYKSGPSHLGIYIGNGDFIHAGVTHGVSTANLNDNYWKSKYLGAKRIN